MEPKRGIGRLKPQNQIVKWITLVVLIAATSFLMGQAAPNKKTVETQTISRAASPRPDPSAFRTYEDYIEVGYNPFGAGSFPSPHSAGGRLLGEIGARHKRSPRQVALSFLTRYPGVFTVPKASTAEHVRENAGGAGWTLSDDEIAAIPRALR
jgi:hypothetical protein